MEWTSTVVTANGGNWLSMTPSSGTVGPPPSPLPDGPTEIETSVSVTPTGLSPGVYTGSITITASRLYLGTVFPATNSPQTATVTYTVTAGSLPTVRVSANSLALSGVAGIGSIATSPVAISNSGLGTLNWSAAVQPSPSAPWLSVSPASGVDSGNLILSATPALLAPGVYTANVTVGGAGSPTQTIAVTYTVRAPKPATLDVVTTALNFTAPAETSPPVQGLAVANSGELVLNWRAAASTFNGGQWLSAAPAIGTNNGTVVISPSAANLAPGVYAGRVTVSSDLGLQAQIQVNFTVTRATPNLTGGGFYNAASLLPEGVVAGSIASVFGAHLGPDPGVSSTPDAVTAKVPTSLAGTRVTIDGVAAPLFYSSAKQINLQIPYEAAGKTSATAHIEADGYDPADFRISLSPADVGIFTVDGTRATALNQDGTLNTGDSPAPAGSIVQFYATGQGVLNLAVPTGGLDPAQAPFPAPMTPITVQIGGVPAKIVFVGLAPGAVGMLQLNVQVPASVPPGLTAVQTQTATGKPSLVYIATSAPQ